MALLAATLLGQLAARANRADDATATVRRDGRSITVLFDRTAPAGPLGPGWAKSEPGKGALSADRTAYVLMPTSTAVGDVELCLVLAADGPRARPVGVAIDDHPIGAWTPRGVGQETACFLAPSKVRFRSYDLLMVFDLADGAPIRIVSASSRIRPPAA
ncbi:hypothetical protein [Caulobacter sp. 1776]|uniref:hypothetical protein n=1 Tax=Caulobacter sp. 1776 TaxID=3156420 RepID=UPI00339B1DA5